MKIIRVFSGEDGESHFEDVTAEEMATIVNRVGPGDITLGLRPSPSFSDYHNAPRRQYVVNLSGTAEFECADGSKIQMEDRKSTRLNSSHALISYAVFCLKKKKNKIGRAHV